MEDDIQLSSPAMVSKQNIFLIRKDSIEDNLSADDIFKMFDEFLVEFAIMEKSDGVSTKVFLDAVEDITNGVLLITPSKLCDPKVFGHELFLFLRQIIIDLLENWQGSHVRLNIQETDIFLKIVLIFLHMFEQPSSQNIEEDQKRIRNFLATDKLLPLIRQRINDTILNKHGTNDDPNICTLGLLTIKLLKGCDFYFSKPRQAALIRDLIYNCLDSFDFIQAIQKLKCGEELNDIDRFLLYTCWEYVPFARSKSTDSPPVPYLEEVHQTFYDELLTRFETILDEPTITTPDALSYIFQRSNQLLTVPNLTSFDSHASNLIDRLTNILKDPKSLAINHVDHDAVVNAALQTFHNMSNHFELCSIMKKYPLRSVIEPYAQNRTDEKANLAFAVLAEIMNEQEIQTNANQLTSNLIGQLKELHSNGDSAQCDKSLSSLNALIQHEQIKSEFVKQGGLDTLVSFICDGDLNGKNKKQVEAAMQTLWSCAFGNPEALDTLKQDKELMARVNQILKESKECGDHELEKAAEGLIWKVEKEGKFLEERMAEAEKKRQERQRKAAESGTVEEEEEEEEKPKYDCMISYSWGDMDLVHRVAKTLSEKHGYKVWLDQEQMHGSTIDAMANAVESAEYFLMFMSQTYKRSANCQSEAEYAFNRKKHIVPIKVKKDYAADGWLGFILGTRLYIDFGTYDFDKAMQLLVNEIELQKKKKKVAIQNARAEREANGTPTMATANPDEEEKGKEDVSKCKTLKNGKIKARKILNWDKKKVRNFLIEHNLISMALVCDGMTGEELSKLYEMCDTDSVTMHRLLHEEILLGYNRVLPICTFLRFVSCMSSVCTPELSQ